MRHVFLRIIFFSCSLVGLIGCNDCGPSAEPSMFLGLSWPTPGRIDTFYALSSQRALPTQPYSTTALISSYQFTVPLNLNADSSQYVVQQAGRRDTVTVYYKRNYAYRNTKCGYVLDLTAPADQQATITRGTILSVQYEQNSYYNAFPGKARQTGIYLSARL